MKTFIQILFFTLIWSTHSLAGNCPNYPSAFNLERAEILVEDLHGPVLITLHFPDLMKESCSSNGTTTRIPFSSPATIELVDANTGISLGRDTFSEIVLTELYGSYTNFSGGASSNLKLSLRLTIYKMPEGDFSQAELLQGETRFSIKDLRLYQR